MRELWDAIKDFCKRDWTTTEKVLIVLCCLLLGMVKGFFLAPIKKGINCGNNNGNKYCGEDEYWLDDED